MTLAELNKARNSVVQNPRWNVLYVSGRSSIHSAKRFLFLGSAFVMLLIAIVES